MKTLMTTLWITSVSCLACSLFAVGDQPSHTASHEPMASYYIHAQHGDDARDGLSKETAWKSLANVNRHVFKPGDAILFAAGTVYEGQLAPQGSGKEGAPIKMDRYGDGANPVIHGKGQKDYTLLLHNVEHWEVRNLEITNRGAARKGGRRGVVVRAEDFGDCRGIILEGLVIHQVNGALEKRNRGGGSGIFLHNGGENVKTRFVNLQILNNWIHHCERNAINFAGNARRTEWHPSLGVVVRGNLIEHVPGDGIVVIGCEGALVEYNVIRKGVDLLPVGDAAAGIWPWSSDHTLIQFNEVSDHRAKWDGQGFDADFNCIGSIFQYNLSFDNWGGFMLICNKGESLGEPLNIGTKNTMVRYNLSINDGLRPYKAHNKRFFSPVFHITGPVDNTTIERNIIIIPEKPLDEIENTLLEFGNWGRAYPHRTAFMNNIVRSRNAFENRMGGATAFAQEGNDLGQDFDYQEVAPDKVLMQLRDHPLIKRDEKFEILYQFVKHRQKNGDPRFAVTTTTRLE